MSARIAATAASSAPSQEWRNKLCPVANIDAAKGYLKINPGSADAWNNIGDSDLMLGRYDEAIRDETIALRLDPSNQLARNNLSWIVGERAKAKGGNAPPPPSVALSRAAPPLNVSLRQYNSGQFTACVESAKTAIKLDPNYAEVYNNLAACESASGHYDAAIAAAREALRLKPDLQLARNNLDWALKAQAGKCAAQLSIKARHPRWRSKRMAKAPAPVSIQQFARHGGADIQSAGFPPGR